MSTAVTILGNTGRDVELRYTPQGVAVANFSVASNTVRATSEGQQKKTDWFNVTAFGKQAETLARHLKKGSQVLVRGRLTFNPWLSRDGSARVSADVAMQDFEFAGNGNSNGARSAAVETEETPSMTGNAASAIAGENESETDDVTAEMIEALRESEIGEEPFAGQF